MIKFFRHIRQALLQQNRITRYLIYALGEIILVVIGILIALEFNNLNEQRKQADSKMAFTIAILIDLQKDVRQLQRYNEVMIEDLKLQNQHIDRMRAPHANVDTLIKIARYEHNPYYDPGTALNTSAYESVLNTGSFEILDSWLQEGLLNLNAIHLESMTVIEYALEHHKVIFTDYDKDFLLRNSEDERLMNEKMTDEFWENIPKKEIQRRFMGVFESKYLMQEFIVNRRQNILTETENLISKIHSVYPELNAPE